MSELEKDLAALANGEKLERFRLFLQQENEKYNLTALTQAREVRSKHFYDSLFAVPLLPHGAKVCDVGSGAGLPLIPLALARPDCAFTGVDATEKKVAFINAACALLELDNCRAVHMRAEDMCRQNRGAFDAVTARGVAELATLAEYCLPLLREGGELIAYKGPLAEQELEEAQKALQVLGGRAKNVLSYSLPTGEERRLIVIEKVRPTPEKYPRGGNKPRLKPLK